MKQTLSPASSNWKNSDRERLRHRVKRMVEHFNQEEFADCYLMLDPKLRAEERIAEREYIESLRRFREVYGDIDVYQTRLLGTWNSANMNGDRRPFAYAEIVWFDASGRIHFFRERWIKDADAWYSRVVGLVAYKEDEPIRIGDEAAKSTNKARGK